jgi:hypothetical protein
MTTQVERLRSDFAEAERVIEQLDVALRYLEPIIGAELIADAKARGQEATRVTPPPPRQEAALHYLEPLGGEVALSREEARRLMKLMTYNVDYPELELGDQALYRKLERV